MTRFLLSACIAASLLSAADPQGKDLPEGPAKPLVLSKCASCHELRVVTTFRASAEDWEASLNRMTTKGVNLSDEQFDAILDYLSQHFGPVQVNVNKAPAGEMESKLGLSSQQAAAVAAHRERHGKIPDWNAFYEIIGRKPDNPVHLQKRVVFQ
jgi:hypothetical protein